MKSTRVTVRFVHGLHARTAAQLIHLFRKFRCRIHLRVGNRVASASSILSILVLAAGFNAQLEVQASGEDEDAAIQAAEAFFQLDDHGIESLSKGRREVSAERRNPSDAVARPGPASSSHRLSQ